MTSPRQALRAMYCPDSVSTFQDRLKAYPCHPFHPWFTNLKSFVPSCLRVRTNQESGETSHEGTKPRRRHGMTAHDEVVGASFAVGEGNHAC